MGASNIADPKLQHLITKIIKAADSKELTSTGILDTLLNKHREYRRKNSSTLLTCIEYILTDFGKQQGLRTSVGAEGIIVGNSATPGAARNIQIPIGVTPSEEDLISKKRRRELESDEEYEKEAAQNDLNQIQSPGSSMLNANLRNRYKDVQKERDVANKKKAAEEEKKALAEAESQNEVDMSDTDLPIISENSAVFSGKTQTPGTPLAKKKKKKISRSSSSSKLYNDDESSTTTMVTKRPIERYKDLGGMCSVLTQIRQLIEYPLAHPELFAHLGIHPPRGVLLRGPPGCGKTHLANAIAGQLNVTYFKVSAPELVSGMSGESESRIRDLFTAASAAAPSIIFMDEIDAIAPKRGDGSSGGTKGMEKRMVAQLLTCMDSLTPENNRGGAPVMVLGATNMPDSIDSALRRAGRFDREICLGVPDEAGRLGILKVMTADMRLSGDIEFKVLAKKTPGFVGADIRSLTKEAGVIAINRIFKKVLINGDVSLPSSDVTEQKEPGTVEVSASTEIKEQSQGTSNGSDDVEHSHSEAQDVHSVVPLTSEQLEPLYVTMADFLEAVPHVQPSSKREGFATVPDVSWDNVGALQSTREELSLSVLEPITHPEKFEALGLPLPAGVLLYGPPGCGKTLLAKAIAHESGANFISVKGPELLDKYVGESERAVRRVFERARSSAPCIVFFDELDSLCPKRGSDSGGGNVSERVVNQLLTEMDGLDDRRSVFVIAATNRPELIDPAMLRPGRLDKLLYIPLPTPADRAAILKAVAKKVKLGPDVDLEVIAHSNRAEGYSGADCAALLREAGLAVLRDDTLIQRGFRPAIAIDESVQKDIVVAPLQITMEHFNYAFDHVMPSVSRKDQAKYDRIRDRMARARSRGGVDEKAEETQSSEGNAQSSEGHATAGSHGTE
jgi:ribosome biogenesis ATPase